MLMNARFHEGSPDAHGALPGFTFPVRAEPERSQFSRTKVIRSQLELGAGVTRVTRFDVIDYEEILKIVID